MTEPRTPGDPAQEPNAEPAAPDQAAGAPADLGAGNDSPTEAWPSLRPSSDSAPSAASWASPASATPPTPDEPAEPTLDTAAPAAPAAASPYEPSDPLPDSRLETGGFGASTAVVGAPPAKRSRSGLRWGLALLGILIVIGATALIVYLAGGRPASSNGLGYMPATTAQYSEVRLDLPGDQRQKLAGFLASFPGFKDQSQIEPKLNDVLDRIVRAASDGKQTYTTDIAPWFGGQVSIGSGLPALPPVAVPQSPTVAAMGADNMLVVIGITDRAKAQTWLTSLLPADGKKESYNGADIWTASNPSATAAVALTDKVMLLGSASGVRAAVDSKGEGSLASDADFKAAFAQIDRDYVFLSVIRTRPYVDAVTTMVDKASPGVLAGTQLDETITAMIPAWQGSIARFENDALVSTSVYPSYAIGYDSTNHKSTLTGHVPATTFIYAETHDVGPALSAVLAKFRALPETKAAFQAFDQAVSILGGFDAVLGWWGDAAFVVAPSADGTIGGGLVIQPRDKAAAERLFTTLRGFLTLAGSSSGITVRDEDHGGTKITILDFSTAPGMTPGSLPPGFKPEFAFAVSNDVVAVGYGRDFVASVLDAGAGSNLAADDRYKKLIGRVGEENLSLTYVDINAMRGLIEPLIRQAAPEAWTAYESDIKPYLEHLDAVISAIRRDGSVDRANGAVTTR